MNFSPTSTQPVVNKNFYFQFQTTMKSNFMMKKHFVQKVHYLVSQSFSQF